MKKYIGTKVVEAEPMTRGSYNKYRGWTIPADEDPNDPGYLIRYQDGYESWSLKRIFDEAYMEVDDNLDPPSGIRIDQKMADETNTPILGGEVMFGFNEAIKYVKRGIKMKRKGWNGKNQYIELATGISYMNPDGVVVNPDHKDIGNNAIAFVGTSGVQLGWLASQADMLAEDWMFA